jgi:hypothetical protein
MTILLWAGLLLWMETRDLQRIPPRPAPFLCQPTRAQTLLPSILGPMVGNRPAWIVDGTAGRWQSHGVKTLWVLSRTTQTVRIEGRRLDGSDILKFRRGQNEAFTDALVIDNPASASVIPGGATSEIMSAYSFIPSNVLYPSPGCWGITIRIDDEEVHIVTEMKSVS